MWHYVTIETTGNFWEKERINMGAAYREELSANARKLIEQLLSLPQGWVTAAALAESIGVSRRTVAKERSRASSSACSCPLSAESSNGNRIRVGRVSPVVERADTV